MLLKISNLSIKKGISINKLLSLHNLFYIVLPLIFLSLVIYLSVKSSTIPVNAELPDFNIKNTENDKIVTPTSEVENPIQTGENVNKKIEVNNYFVENLLNNWTDLFELFAFNPAYAQKVKSIDSLKLENISEVVKTTEDEFRPGKLGNVQKLVEEYGEIIKRECAFYKLDWRLILAMIRQESYFNTEAVSHAGAFGLMQIMPRTGAGIQSELKIDETRTPENNLIAGIYYFANMTATFDFVGEDKFKFALASYNAGLGRAIDAMTITAFLGKDYTVWDNVKESYKLLPSSNDSLHALVWPNSKRPQYGALNNWKEPYNYVNSIMFYYNEYKKLYESNLPEEKITKKKKKKKK